MNDLPLLLFDHDALRLRCDPATVAPALDTACGDCPVRLPKTRSSSSIYSSFAVMGWDYWKTTERLAWTTVKLIDHGPPCLQGVEVIAMDEFAIQKGHRYATVIVEPYRKRVLWVGRGRGLRDVRPTLSCLVPNAVRGCELCAWT